MLALKAFVQESVQGLGDAELQLLSETLRIDLRGCDGRRDIERVVTGLVCLDQDTALGVFLSWLRTSSDSSSAHTKTKPFHNTFVPTIAPLDQQQQHHHHMPLDRPEDQVKDHHLDDEIETRLAELQLLETEFKSAERVAHAGTPSFDKMKQFLVKLTVLRAKEEETRRFFIKQNALLKQQRSEMREETLHTRSQLDFFVDGFTNLRLRHDALIEKSTQMHAESEIAQEIFLSMSTHESHFAAIMAHTLEDQRAKNLALQARFDAAEDTIRALEEKQLELVNKISQLKHARGDAQKDAHCYKRQLRVCKRKMASMEQASTDCVYFRAQAMNLRQSFASLLGYLRESVLRDTKTPKQALSKEALRIIHHAVNGSAAASPERSASSSDSAMNANTREGTQETAEGDAAADVLPKVVKRAAESKRDLDEAVRGILLLGGADGESAQCASVLSAKFKYAPIDVGDALEQFEKAEREKHRQQQIGESNDAMAPTSEAMAQTTEKSVPGTPASPARPLLIESYQEELTNHIQDEMQNRGARGFVLFNWEFTARDANRFIALGFPIDSIIELQSPVAPISAVPKVSPPALIQAEKVTAPIQQATGSPSRSKAGATLSSSPTKPNAARTPSTSAMKSTPSPSSPTARSSAKPAAAAPTVRGATRQSEVPKTSETTRRAAAAAAETPSRAAQQSSSPSKRPTATPQTAQITGTVSPEKKDRMIDRKAAFKGMLHMYQQIAPATFPEERTDGILAALEQQREKRNATSFVQWDEASARTNELLSMFAEDVHMMMFVEQENRKPKKPGDSSGAPPSRGTISSPTKPGGTTSKSTSPSKGSPARKTSTARGFSKSPPSKTTSAARGSGASAVATTRRATSTATSPASRRSSGASPDMSKRASVTTVRLQS